MRCVRLDVGRLRDAAAFAGEQAAGKKGAGQQEKNRGPAGPATPRAAPAAERAAGTAERAASTAYGASRRAERAAAASRRCPAQQPPAGADRKSTRLNSSHLGISYA